MIKNMTGIALVRSLVQWGFSKLLASSFGVAAVTFLVEELGWQIDEAWLVNGTSIFIFGLVVVVGNKLGTRFAWINKIISAGLSGSSPVYVPAGDVAVGATVTPDEGTTVFTETGAGEPAPPVFEDKPPASPTE